MTSIVNLYAGPGAGKSTSAAYLYTSLKQLGVNAELTREFVKNWAYEERNIRPFDQFYFLGKQIRYESLCLDKVDVIVTDSPVWLCAYYAEKKCPSIIHSAIEIAVKGYYDLLGKEGHKVHNVFIKRTKEYNPVGRWETEEQAKEVDNELETFLVGRNVDFEYCGTSREELDIFLNKYIIRK